MSSTPKIQPAGGTVRRTESRGSVLIFVVGVLLLLAIVATAFLGSSRADRTATQQNAFNTQIDLLVEGVLNTAKAKISSDESIPGKLAFEAFDSYTTLTQTTTPAGIATGDDWLAARAPVTRDPLLISSIDKLNAGTNRVIWPVVSAAMLGDRFESPYIPGGPYVGSGEYQAREQMEPTFLDLGGKRWPAFRIDTSATPLPGNTNGATRYQSFLAGDADGDGIADSGLFRLPIGQLAGVTYFGAVRIVDNSSAVNVNTAMSRDWEFQGDGQGQRTYPIFALTPHSGAFTSSIGLLELLRSGPSSAPPTAPQFDNMSAVGVNEFDLLNAYRFGFPTGTTQVRPLGVDGGPYSQPVVAANKARQDFVFDSMSEALNRQLGERMTTPGYTYGTVPAPTAAKSAFRDSLLMASRFAIGSPDDAGNALFKTLATSLQTDPPLLAQTRTRPYDASAAGSGVDGWFGYNFDYLRETTDPTTLDPRTFMNRRTLFTGYNAVSNQEQTREDVTTIPPAVLYSEGALAGRVGLANQVVYQPHNSQNQAVPAAATVQPPMFIPNMPVVGGVPQVGRQSKVDINTARFEELFYGFFKTMAQTNFNGGGDGAGTPFSTFYEQARTLPTARRDTALNTATAVRIFTDGTAAAPAGPGTYYRDPYIGMRFETQLAAALAGTTHINRNEPNVMFSLANGQQNVPEQHPLRQFRSVLRAPHDRSALRLTTEAQWDNNTPYLPADQVLILRAAIAAANAEGLRNSSQVPAATTTDEFNDRIVPHEIPLLAHVPLTVAPPRVIEESNRLAETEAFPVVAHVYGLRRQPYITEVYVNTDPDDRAVGTLPAQPANPQGYIAIKIYNPHPVDISLENCRLVGLRRYREMPVQTTVLRAATTQYPNITVSPPVAGAIAGPPPPAALEDQVRLNELRPNDVGGNLTPWIIPAGGFLVIENYPVAPLPPNVDPGAALHRPTLTGMDPTAAVTMPANGRLAYLPHLDQVTYDREMVLVRPLNATPPVTGTTPLVYTWEDPGFEPRVDRMAPLDSYDFTGLTWVGGFISGVGPVTQSRQWHYIRPDSVLDWRWVYPGRYDANQSIPIGPTFPPRPRQEGTEESFSTVTTANPGRDSTNNADNFSPLVATQVSLLATSAGPIYYPDSNFAIQLNASGWPSDQQLHAAPPAAGGIVNRWPYGGFRRAGDLLQVPFIGSYTIQTEANAATDPTVAANANAIILEMNAVTMDAALAEDTDTYDNPRPADNGTQSREQIGRFCPLRPSIGRDVPLADSGTAVEEAYSTPVAPALRQHWVFFNGRTGTVAQDFIDQTNSATGFAQGGDPRRYQDDMEDELFRTTFGVTLNRVPPAYDPYPPVSTNQTWTNRYHWARALFDHFTINGPQDDAFGAYPMQPRWRPGVRYEPGDAVSFGNDIFICLARQAPEANDPPPAATLDRVFDTTTWQRLPREAIKNGGATLAGNLSDIPNGAASFFYRGAVGALDNDSTEVTEPVQGLVNINTAPEKVLAMIPWVRPGDNYTFNTNARTTYEGVNFAVGSDGIPDNEQIAREIAIYRSGRMAGAWTIAPANEPFRTIFDLYKVPVIRNLQNFLNTNTANPAGGAPTGDLGAGLADGDYSPLAATPDLVRHDFEEQYLILNRVSSLITTRSDTFTLYILVQGWRNVGTQKPELVTQRRAAVMVDRSRMTEKGTETLKQLSKVQTQ